MNQALLLAFAGLTYCAAFGLGMKPTPAMASTIGGAISAVAPPAPVDLLAFYCAGRVAANGADPYLAEPLRACEHRVFLNATGHASRYRDLVIPAPLPPYAILALEPFGSLPFAVARTALVVCLGAASLFLVFALAALARRSFVLLMLGVAIGVLVPALELGQIAPLAVVALAGSAWAFRADRIVVGSLLAVLTLVEPHIGIAAMAALFVTIPASRVWLALGAATCGAASLASGGLSRNVEYIAAVLPAQARAEGLSFGGQYSLSAVLMQSGASENTALLAGSLSFLAMLLIGVLTARAVYRKTHDAASAVAVAPAFVLMGGAYVHIHQMAAALPLAVLLLGSKRYNLIVSFALFGLLVPWDAIERSGVLSAWFNPIPPHDAHVALAAVADPRRLAEDSWGVWVRSNANGNRPALEQLLFKLPTWVSLTALCVLSLMTGFANENVQSDARDRNQPALTADS